MRSFHPQELSGRHVLDGGFATELQRLGLVLDGPLWSARALEESPEAVLAVHRAYLDAGAEILLTTSYQVSALGFARSGLAPELARAAAAAALRRSVELACRARAEAGRPEVRIAASLGPYGAALGGGAEYHGRYGFPDAKSERAALTEFHAERIAELVGTEADLLAFETVPSMAEAEAMAEALRGFPGVGAWVTFTCRDGEHTGHGERLRACAARLDREPQVVAAGVNCTAPRHILPLIAELRRATAKPVVVYPNSGEGWDAEARRWTGEAGLHGFEAQARAWFAAGAQVVGGCCRTGPEHVRAIFRAREG